MNINANPFTGSYTSFAAPAAVGLESVAAKSEILSPIVETAKSAPLNVRRNPADSGVAADIQLSLKSSATAAQQLGLESPSAGEQLGLESPSAEQQLGLKTVNSEGKQSSMAAADSQSNAQSRTIGQGRTKDRIEMRQLEADQARIRQLASRDREVRNHEQAHAAIGGKYASSPSYSTVRGPDGVNYAVGGEVSISSGSIPGNPEASIRKALQVQRAALAPADPSSADRQIAARASQIILEAQAQIQQLSRQEQVQKLEEASEKRAEGKSEAVKSDSNSAVATTVTAGTEFSPFSESNKTNNEDAGSIISDEEKDKERQAQLNEANKRSFDINQKLINLGLAGDTVDVGAILSAVI